MSHEHAAQKITPKFKILQEDFKVSAHKNIHISVMSGALTYADTFINTNSYIGIYCTLLGYNQTDIVNVCQ